MPKIRISPYTVGKPVTGSEFAGREEILAQAENSFNSPGIPAVVIFGQRRIGKTSILLELKRRLTANGSPVVYLDLMEQASEPLGKVLLKLAKTICRDLKLPIDLAKINFDDEGISFQEEFLPLVKDNLHFTRLALLFDEFDVLDIIQRERLPDTIAANRFFSVLRRWMQEEPALFFGFVLGRELNNLDTDFLATFKGAIKLRISVLNRSDVEKLLTAPGVLNFAESGIDRIFQLTHGHPILVQLFGQLAFEIPASVEQINAEIANDLIPKILEASDYIFDWVWVGLPSAERILISAFAELLKNENETANKDDLLNALQSKRIRLISADLLAAPDKLVELQILEKKGADNYRFLVPIFSKWVAQKWPLSKTQEEVDRINPRAQHYFEIGRMELEDGHLETALENLQHALSANPDHLQARLKIGETFLRLGRIDEAVNAYEEAARRSDSEAASGLMASLLRRATESKDPKAALSDLARVLDLNPANREALELQTKFYKMLGDQAFEDNDLPEALRFYKKGRLSDQAEKVERKISQIQDQINTLLSSAHESAGKKEWQSAIELYRKVLEIEPENSEAKQGIQENLSQIKKAEEERNQAEEQKTLRAFLSSGKAAFRAENYDAAIENFKNALNIDPDNKEASDLLEEAYSISKLHNRLNQAKKKLKQRLFEDARKILGEEPRPDGDNATVIELKKEIETQAREFKRIAFWLPLLLSFLLGGILTISLGLWLAAKITVNEPGQQIFMALSIGLYGFAATFVAIRTNATGAQKTRELLGGLSIFTSVILIVANIIPALIAIGIGYLFHWLVPGSWWGFYVPTMLWNGIFILVFMFI